MNKLLWTIFRAAVFVLLAAPACSEPVSYMDGNKLHVLCKSADLTEASLCLGYVTGVVDSVQAQEDDFLTQYKFKLICIPPNVTPQQVIDVYRKFSSETPEKRHLPAAALVYAAITKAWPCK